MKQLPSFDAMLRDPRIYEVNTVPAHSDHIFYSDEAHRQRPVQRRGAEPRGG